MNSNVLEGSACPQCGSEGPFEIVADCYAIVSDNGVGDTRDFAWDESSLTRCTECDFKGDFREFAIPPKQPKAQYIQGTITLTNGETAQFGIGRDCGWQQWAVDKDTVKYTAVILEALVEGLRDNPDLLITSDDED